MTTLNLDNPTVAQSIALKTYLVDRPLQVPSINWSYETVMQTLANAPGTMTANEALEPLGMRVWMDYAQHPACAVRALIFHTHRVAEHEFENALNEMARIKDLKHGKN